MMNSSIVNTNTDISVTNTGINRVNRDRDADIFIHDERDRELSPDISVNSRSVRSLSIESNASAAQQSAQLASCSSGALMSSIDEQMPSAAKKRRKQSNPVRYGLTTHPINTLPIASEGVPQEEDEEADDDDDDESLIAAGLQVSSQLQRSGSFSSSDADSNDDEDMDLEPSLDLERRKLLQQSVMNFHKLQHMCPHCNCPFLNDDDLRSHIEEEHVQKLLERQLFQQHHHRQQQLNSKSLLNGPNQLRDSLSELCKYDQNQNKFHSSDSRSDSSSSGSNNNSPLQSPSARHERKSFDGSLPLPHGSSDSNIKDFGSNFLAFQMPPNMPPLVSQSGGTASGGAGEGSKSTSPGAAPLSLAMFSNPMAPFLFPMGLPSGPNSGSNGSGLLPGQVVNGGQQVSSGGIRIFNPEAYCELCNKEFCNKYFLKTHKANKHGIYSMDTLVGPQGYGTPFGSFPTGLSTSPGGQSSAAAAAAMQMQHLLQSSAGLTPTTEALVVSTPMRSNVVNIESYCEICQKEFCNKYFLKKHKQKIHGIHDNTNPSQSSSASPGSCSNEPHHKGSPSPPPNTSNTSISCMAVVPASTTPVSRSPSMAALERPQQMATPSMVSSQTSSPTNNFVCEICKQEFPNIISLQTHRFTTHYPTSMHAMGANLSSAHLQSMAGDSPSRPILGPVSSLSESANFVFTAEKLREMGVINADAFCEICCKEFCNKYFLRTHKINKHGMSFDSNSSTKSQSGPNSGDAKGDDSNNMSANDNDDSFLEPGQRDPTTYSNGSEFFNAMSGIHSELQCELCSRPFASHYLLKMHKFYSHNIPYIKEEDIRKSMAASPGVGGEVPNDSLMKGMSDSSDNVKSSQIVRQHNADNSGNGQTGGNDESSDDESNGPTESSVTADQASQDLQKLQTMIKELNSSSYLDKALCNLCRQEFENKYFLRVHMMNDHGVIAAPEDTAAAAIDSNAFMRNLFDGNRQAFPLGIQSGLQSGDSEAFCDICHREFCSKYFLKTHKQNVHGIYEGPPTPTEATAPPFPQQTSPHTFPPHRKSVDEAVNLAMSPNRNKSQMSAQSMHLVAAKQMSQMPTQISQMSQLSQQSLVSQTGQLNADGKPRNITGRNYCNICNKELCNKYFMKTHMLKMHGINIDEHPVEASANSTIGGVTCDICQKELCSKYFLKVHKQNTHGIYEEPPQPKEPRNVDLSAGGQNAAVINAMNDRDSQAVHGIDPNDTNNRYFSHYTEVCPLCERRFKSIKWLKTHMINDHSDIVAMKPTDLSITGPNADLSRLCVLCGQTFSDRVALHIHLVKDHRTTAEELGISGNMLGNMSMKGSAPGSATDLSFKGDPMAMSVQLAQHLYSSRVNGSSSPSSQGSQGMAANQNSSQTSLNANSNSLHSKMIGIIAPNITNMSSAMTSTPTNTIITCSANPMNSTNTSHSDTNNAIHNTINTNNINTTNACNKNNTTNSGPNIGQTNQSNTGVITCPKISTPSLVTSGNTSPTCSTAVVKEDRQPSALLSSSFSSIISKRTSCGTRIYQCSYCNYSTRWLSNLYAHEKRHTRLNTEADKKFVCRVCHRAYRYNHSLQRHLLNHRSGGLNGRDINAIAVLASTSSKGLLSSTLHGSSSADKMLAYDSKLSRLLPSGSSHPSLHRSLVGPNRVKRYRCSKCNKKFRTRDLCLAHIRVYHTDSRKIMLSSTASAKLGANRMCRCAFCGFTTRNITLLKIHINKNHSKVTKSPANDLNRMAAKVSAESPLNLRKQSMENRAPNEALSLVTSKPESAASPSISSGDDESMGGSGRRASGQSVPMGAGCEQSPQLPMTYAMPQSPPQAGSFIMQPFLITQPDTEGAVTNDTFVPSLVYLPVSHKVLQPVRVAFHLTPA